MDRRRGFVYFEDRLHCSNAVLVKWEKDCFGMCQEAGDMLSDQHLSSIRADVERDLSNRRGHLTKLRTMFPAFEYSFLHLQCQDHQLTS